MELHVTSLHERDTVLQLLTAIPLTWLHVRSRCLSHGDSSYDPALIEKLKPSLEVGKKSAPEVMRLKVSIHGHKAHKVVLGWCVEWQKSWKLEVCRWCNVDKMI